LLRLPYGKQTEPIDSFPFEELRTDSAHEAYLWGNSALLCGYLFASAFQANGWDMEDDNSGEIGELPVHSFTQDGESKVKPCAEAWLTERAAQKILSQGLIPVLSIKCRDAVRVAVLQSLAGSAFSIG
jgi:type VI secretion system protein ImpC